jgi:hypothetical protein
MVRKLKYYLQPGHAGPQEAFAELFAQLFGAGAETSAGTTLSVWFKGAAAIVAGLI